MAMVTAGKFLASIELRDLLCVIPQSISLFRSSYNTLAGLYALVLATPHAFTLRSLAIVSHPVHFLDNNH